eukprot:11737505-Alexandrium_andersonii.AAC.1
MRAGAEAFVYGLVATPGLAAQERGSPKVVSRSTGAGSQPELIGACPHGCSGGAAPRMFVGACPPP